MRADVFLKLALAFSCLSIPLATNAQERVPAARDTPAQTQPAPSGREKWQRVPDIFAALGAKEGSRIADLGAGEGWLTLRLARQVGPRGRVFAVDISADALGKIAKKLEGDTLRNVELMLAEEDDPRLPFGTLDGVVILNAYHEMTKRVPVLEGVKRSLRPGGVVVIVDNTPAGSRQSRQDQMAYHTLALDFARADLEAQGFEIVASDSRFIDAGKGEDQRRQWLLVGRRRMR